MAQDIGVDVLRDDISKITDGDSVERTRRSRSVVTVE
jgi:hypothetical protein